MPRRSLRPCNHPACGALTRDGSCPNHPKKERAAQHDRVRGSAASRGYDRRWRRLRLLIIARDPMCTCSGYGGCDHEPNQCRKPTEDVDHRVPKEQGGEDTEENLHGMCHACHSRKTAQEDGGWGHFKPARKR